MEAKIYIPDNLTYTTDFYIDSFDYTEVYYNALEPADNSCRITIPFNEELSDKLKIFGDKDIKIEIKKDNGTNLITGYLRKSYSFEKTQRHQGIALEIVSPSYLLKINLTTGFYLTNNTISQIVNRLLNEAGFPNSSIVLNTVIRIFTVEAGEEIYSVLKQLLFEYEYTFDFNADGNFVLYPLFNKPVGNILQHFNGFNIREKLIQELNEKTYEDITTNWSTSEYYTNVLLYENTEGRNAAHPDGCQIEVYPNSYLFGNEWNVLNYDSFLGTVVWVDSISVNDNYNTDIKADWPLLVTRPVENLGKSAKLQIKNTSTSAAAFVDRLRIRGNAYIEIPDQINRVPGKGKALNINIRFNHNSILIDSLTKKIAEYYKYARFTVSLKSDEDYPLGSFVVIVEDAMGTVKGRIISKKYKLRQPIEYTIESIEEYSPIENVEVLRKASTKMNNLLAVPPDITPPTNPTITNIAQNADGSISITFNPSSDNESGVNYYNVYRCESSTATGTKETPTVILSLEHTGSPITFIDHSTNNSVWYFYQITAVDKANNESGKSNELSASSKVTEHPKTPYLIKAEADQDGVDVLIFIRNDADSTSFKNEISETLYFRLQNSYNNGVTWNELGKIQGNTYFWKYESSFIVNTENLNKLKFRAFGWNMFNIENTIPIEMMNHQVKHNLANIPPPYNPPKEIFTELILELVIENEYPYKYTSLIEKINLLKGWYYVICSAGGAGGSGGGGGGGGTWGKGAGATGATGGKGGKGQNSFLVNDDISIIANGGEGYEGGVGGSGGGGGGIGKPSTSGNSGESGVGGQDGGYIEMSFFKSKDETDKNINNTITKSTTIQAGSAGYAGNGGSGGLGR
jgi:hypothetical protein